MIPASASDEIGNFAAVNAHPRKYNVRLVPDPSYVLGYINGSIASRRNAHRRPQRVRFLVFCDGKGRAFLGDFSTMTKLQMRYAAATKWHFNRECHPERRRENRAVVPLTRNKSVLPAQRLFLFTHFVDKIQMDK